MDWISIGGTFLVLLFIAISLSLTHGVALTAVGTVPRGSIAHTVLLTLIYVQAGMALLCLVGILYVNPGVIPRTVETCNPIPSTMQEWVVANQQSPHPSRATKDLGYDTNAVVSQQQQIQAVMESQ